MRLSAIYLSVAPLLAAAEPTPMEVITAAEKAVADAYNAQVSHDA